MATLAANATPEAKKARNDEACSTAETFVNLGCNLIDILVTSPNVTLIIFGVLRLVRTSRALH